MPIVTEALRQRAQLPRRSDWRTGRGPQALRLVADQLSITVSLVPTYQEMLTREALNLSRYFSRGLTEHLLADGHEQLGGDLKL